MLAACDEAEGGFRAFRRAPRHRLTVALFRGYKPTDNLATSLERHFENAGLFVETRFVDIGPGDPVEGLGQGEVDLALIGASPDFAPDGLESLTYIVGPTVAVVGTNHPLAARETLSPQDLDAAVVWLSDGPRHLYAHLRTLLEERGVRPDYQLRPWTNAAEMYASMPYDTLGVRLTFASIARHAIPALQDSCRVLPFDDPVMTSPLVALWRADDRNPALAAAVEHLRRLVATKDISVYWR